MLLYRALKYAERELTAGRLFKIEDPRVTPATTYVRIRGAACIDNVSRAWRESTAQASLDGWPCRIIARSSQRSDGGAGSSSKARPAAIAAFLKESRAGRRSDRSTRFAGWDTFRSIIAADLETAEAERAILRDRVDSGELVGDERARADLRAQYLRGRIEALREAMDLPKRLIERHESLDKLAGPVGNSDKP